MKKIRSLGCEYGQGFLFSKPLSGEEAEDLLAGAVAGAARRRES